MPFGRDVREKAGDFVGAIIAGGGLFGPGDDLARAWDEAEAILLACGELDAVMEAIRNAESPVEARRALKFGFGFTGRQAALLLTLPVMTFTRSERRRIDENRRDRVAMLADVTGVLPAVRDTDPEPTPDVTPGHTPDLAPATYSAPDPDPAPAPEPSPGPDSAPDLGWALGPEWGTDDGTFDYAWSAAGEASTPALEPLPLDSFPQFGAAESVTGHSTGTGRGTAYGPDTDTAFQSVAELASAPVPAAAAQSDWPSVRRSTSRADDASVVLDEQIGELCEAIAELLRVSPPVGAWANDPRDSVSSAGSLLDSCGVDDATVLRRCHSRVRRTGLDSVEGLFPFAEPLSADQGFDAQAVRFEHAMSTGSLGSEPGGDVKWAGRLWPLAERHGFGYAVSYRSGPDAGVVWAYGGNEPLHRMWDSVLDLLVELYQAFTAGDPCDSALAGVAGGRVVWANLS